MPAAAPFVAIAGAIGAGVAAKAGMMALAVAISIGSSILAGVLRSMDKPDDDFDQQQQGLKLNTRSTQEPLPVVYGVRRVGGNDVFLEVSGTTNQYLWAVTTLSEGECDSIYQVGGVDQVFLDDKIYTDYGGNVAYWFHGGTSTQTYDTNLNTAISKWTDNMRYTSYIVYRLTFDRSYFNSFPSRSIILKGKKLYDFRDSSTAWSDNPVLALYDYLTSTTYGYGISSSKLDAGTSGSWTSAANYCDTKNWTLNMVVDSGNAGDVVDQILAHFRGSLRWYDGTMYLHYADLNYESSQATIEDEHIVRDEKGRAMVTVGQPSRFGRPDALRVKWVNKDVNYELDDIVLGDNSGAIQELALYGCTSKKQAMQLGYYNLERRQLDRTIEATLRADMIQLDPYDIITFNCSAFNIADQTMRVTDASIVDPQMIRVSMVYETLALYDDDYDPSVDTTYTCTLPSPTTPPTDVTGVSYYEETYFYRLRNITRLVVLFDPPTNYPYFSHVEVWENSEPDWETGTTYAVGDYVQNDTYRFECISGHTASSTNEPNQGASWETYWDLVEYTHQFNSSSDFTIDNVLEGRRYNIKLRAVSIEDIKQSLSTCYKISTLIDGYNDAPGSVDDLQAVVNQNSINLYATKLSNPDIEHYEFRLGGWSGGIFLASLRSPNLSLVGVRPGTHYFYVNTLSTNGQYGATPRSVSVNIPLAKGWTDDGSSSVVASLITNGDMETNGNWTDVGSPTTSGQSGTYKYEDSYSWMFTTDAQYEGVKSDTFTTTTGEDYGYSVWVRPSDTSCQIRIRNGADSGWAVDTQKTGLSTATWNLVHGTYTEAAGGSSAYFSVVDDDASGGNTFYIDNAILAIGTFTDTMPFIYSGDEVIRVDHDSALTGTYETPEYDKSTDTDRMVYYDGDIQVIGGGTDWDSLVPTPDTWNDLDVSRAWYQILELDESSTVQISIYHGDSSPPTNEVKRMEILSMVQNARYYSLKVTITDPSAGVYGLVDLPTIKYAT